MIEPDSSAAQFWATATGVAGVRAHDITRMYREGFDGEPVCGAMAMLCEMRRDGERRRKLLDGAPGDKFGQLTRLADVLAKYPGFVRALGAPAGGR